MSFTKETLQKALPAQMTKRISDELVNAINNRVADPEENEIISENIVSYSSVLTQGKFKMSSYMDAVQYCTYKMMGDTNIKAWTKTFPNKYARLVSQKKEPKDINAHVTAYNKNQLVNLVLAQALIPTHILNAHHFQDAINTQVEIMRDPDVNARDRTAAANSLLTHLKQPEVKKVELDVAVKETSVIAELKNQTALLAAEHKRLIEGGVMTAQESAHQSLIIEGELAEGEDE